MLCTDLPYQSRLQEQYIYLSANTSEPKKCLYENLPPATHTYNTEKNKENW